jgi:hypothetical protein
MRRILWFFLLPLAAWAQLEDNTVTISASRQLQAVPPDQAVFTIYLDAPLNASLADVVAPLAGAGISAANLSGVQDYASDQYTMWVFSLTVSLSQLGPALAGLNAASALENVNYSILSQVSPQAQAAQQCPYGLLVQDAQAQAQQLATAAGATVGPIVSVSDGSQLRTGELSGVLSATVGVIDPISRIGVGSILSFLPKSPCLHHDRSVQPGALTCSGGGAGQRPDLPTAAGLAGSNRHFAGL